MTTIKDIARAADVSVTTVSYVLNNKGNISEETRAHVLKVVEGLGYTRSIRARNLREQQSRTIGYAQAANRVAINPILDQFLYELVRLIEPQGRHLLLFSADADKDMGVYRELVDSKRVDGFVLSFTNSGDKRFSFLYEADVPFVALGRSFTPLDDKVYWVDVDGDAGIYDATTHLIAQGHRRIGLVAWPEGSTTGDTRFAGFVKALHAHGIPLEDAYIVRTLGGIENGYASANRLLTQPGAPPTAIVALEDSLALGVLRYCTQHGLRVAVTGFDDVPTSALVQPSLTTLRQPIREIAEYLTDMLIAQLDGIEVEVKHRLIKPELIVRESSLLAPPV